MQYSHNEMDTYEKEVEVLSSIQSKGYPGNFSHTKGQLIGFPMLISSIKTEK